MVIDVFTFNGEYDLLEMRLNILNDYVDEFIIVEAPTTFSGKPKLLYYEKESHRYKDFHHKIKYFVIDENYSEAEINQAEESPNTKGAAHWKREFLQKESIKKALTHLKDDDFVFIGDVDEIWNPSILRQSWWPNTKIKLHVYTYYLNNKSTEKFFGTLLTTYRDMKDECLNHLRSTSSFKLVFPEFGWHFTSMGGHEELLRKLTDSYTDESYAHPVVLEKLATNLEQNKDFLGRDFKYTLSEDDWPQWLKDNRDKYKHLIK